MNRNTSRRIQRIDQQREKRQARQRPAWSSDRLHGEDGVTTIIVALLLVVLLFGAAFAIDGGRGYATGRQMQNAADASAMAGLRHLEQIKKGIEPADTLDDAVFAAAAANGARDLDRCRVVQNDATRSELGDCSDPDVVALPEASGVRVASHTGSENSFAPAVGGPDELSVTRRATAVMQPVSKIPSAPFAVCPVDQKNEFNNTESPANRNYNKPKPNGAALLPLLETRYFGGYGPAYLTTTWRDMTTRIPNASDGPSPGTGGVAWSSWSSVYDAKNFRINPEAFGTTYLVHDGQGLGGGFSRCGNSSASWKGLIDSELWPEVTLPGVIGPPTGTKVGPNNQVLANANTCITDAFVKGCVVVLPICPGSNGDSGSAFRLWCSNFGMFEFMGTTSSGNSNWFKLLRGGNIPIGGVGELGSVTAWSLKTFVLAE